MRKRTKAHRIQRERGAKAICPSQWPSNPLFLFIDSLVDSHSFIFKLNDKRPKLYFFFSLINKRLLLMRDDERDTKRYSLSLTTGSGHKSVRVTWTPTSRTRRRADGLHAQLRLPSLFAWEEEGTKERIKGSLRFSFSLPFSFSLQVKGDNKLLFIPNSGKFLSITPLYTSLFLVDSSLFPRISCLLLLPLIL